MYLTVPTTRHSQLIWAFSFAGPPCAQCIRSVRPFSVQLSPYKNTSYWICAQRRNVIFSLLRCVCRLLCLLLIILHECSRLWHTGSLSTCQTHTERRCIKCYVICENIHAHVSRSHDISFLSFFFFFFLCRPHENDRIIMHSIACERFHPSLALSCGGVAHSNLSGWIRKIKLI